MDEDADLLGVPPGAPPEEVRAAYVRFARRNHPDAGGDAAAFRAGALAYDRLKRRRPASTALVFHRRPRGIHRITAAVGELFPRRTRYVRPHASRRNLS